MPGLVAHVTNGRLVLDEPTDLCEGSTVPLEIARDWDEIDEEERAALHEALDEAEADIEADRVLSEEAVRATLRARISNLPNGLRFRRGGLRPS